MPDGANVTTESKPAALGLAALPKSPLPLTEDPRQARALLTQAVSDIQNFKVPFNERGLSSAESTSLGQRLTTLSTIHGPTNLVAIWNAFAEHVSQTFGTGTINANTDVANEHVVAPSHRVKKSVSVGRHLAERKIRAIKDNDNVVGTFFSVLNNFMQINKISAVNIGKALKVEDREGFFPQDGGKNIVVGAISRLPSIAQSPIRKDGKRRFTNQSRLPHEIFYTMAENPDKFLTAVKSIKGEDFTFYNGANEDLTKPTVDDFKSALVNMVAAYPRPHRGAAR